MAPARLFDDHVEEANTERLTERVVVYFGGAVTNG
jgi:hypothetical protein